MWLTALYATISLCCGVYCCTVWWRSRHKSQLFKIQFPVFVIWWVSMVMMTILDALVAKHPEFRPLLLVAAKVFLLSLATGFVLAVLYIRDLRRHKQAKLHG